MHIDAITESTKEAIAARRALRRLNFAGRVFAVAVAAANGATYGLLAEDVERAKDQLDRFEVEAQSALCAYLATR
jgi:hypothetical protein